MASAPSALLAFVLVASAGCTGAPSASGNGDGTSDPPPMDDTGLPLDQPLPGDQHVDVPAMPGLVLAGDAVDEGQHHILIVTARNEGTRTYWVKNEDCGGQPWHDSMSRDGEPVPHRPPELACDICSSRAFEPGETIRSSFRWDELVWQGPYGESTREDAEAGTYSWTAHLKVREEPGCNEYEPSAAISFDVRVA